VVAQRLDGGGEIRHLKLEPVPASGLGQPAVGHGLATTGPPPGALSTASSSVIRSLA
jgi:hypothetical protein